MSWPTITGVVLESYVDHRVSSKRGKRYLTWKPNIYYEYMFGGRKYYSDRLTTGDSSVVPDLGASFGYELEVRIVETANGQKEQAFIRTPDGDHVFVYEFDIQEPLQNQPSVEMRRMELHNESD